MAFIEWRLNLTVDYVGRVDVGNKYGRNAYSLMVEGFLEF